MGAETVENRELLMVIVRVSFRQRPGERVRHSDVEQQWEDAHGERYAHVWCARRIVQLMLNFSVDVLTITGL